MTELEEKLLAEVTKLETGMNALSGQLTAINGALGRFNEAHRGSAKRFVELFDGTAKFFREQRKYRRCCRSCNSTLPTSGTGAATHAVQT